MDKIYTIGIVQYDIKTDSYYLIINGGKVNMPCANMTHEENELMQKYNVTKGEANNIPKIVKVNGGLP